MELHSWPLRSKYRTVKEIRYAVNTFNGDLKSFPEVLNMDIPQFYDFVKNIPYTKDAENNEIVSRPLYLLTIFPALDCKKKSILFASFMLLKYGHNSYRFVLSSNRPDGKIGHIFTQIFVNDRWYNADATYSKNKLGSKKKVTNFEIVEA